MDTKSTKKFFDVTGANVLCELMLENRGFPLKEKQATVKLSK